MYQPYETNLSSLLLMKNHDHDLDYVDDSNCI